MGIQSARDYFRASVGTAVRSRADRASDQVHIFEYLRGGEPKSIITDDATELLNRAIQDMRQRTAVNGQFYSMKLYGGGEWYYISGSINLTGLDKRGWGLINANFHARCAGKIALDFTGSRWGYLDQIEINGNANFPPSCGFFFGRKASSPSASVGDHYFGALRCSGSFTLAGRIFYGAEVTSPVSIKVANTHPSHRATCSIITGNSQHIIDHCGSMVESDYEPIATGETPQTSTPGLVTNDQRTVAYTYAVLGISKANPAVISVSPANAAAGYWANEGRVYLHNVTGTHADWNALDFGTFELANLNTGAGTAELVGLDTSGFNGTFTSADISNDTGPATLLGHLSGYEEGKSYRLAYSKAKVKLDLRDSGTDENRHIKIRNHSELGGNHLLEIVGDDVANRRVRNLEVDDDASNSNISPILISNVSGSGFVNLLNPKLLFGHASQNALRVFTNPDKLRVYGGEIVVPDLAWVQRKNAFNGASAEATMTARWVGPNGPLHRTIVKDDHTTRNSTTTLTADPHLYVPVLAGFTYRIVIEFAYDSPPTPGFKFGLTGPASPTLLRGRYEAIDPDDAPYNGGFTAYETTGIALTHASNTNNGRVRIVVDLVNGSNAGNVSLTWAQNTSDAGNTSVRRGATIEVMPGV
jgi:hypothetical protein